MRVYAQRFSLLCAVIFVGTVTSLSAQSQTLDLSFPDSQTKRLTVDDVIRMSNAKLSDDVIIQQLKKEGQYFHLTNDQLLQLKTAHVSKQVVQVMMDPYPVTDTSSSETETPKAPAANAAASNASFQLFRQCLLRCNQVYERCRAKAHAKVPDICTSNDDRCAQLAKQLQVEDHACVVQVQTCNAGCQTH